MDGGHLGREILLLLLVWQLVESIKLWQVVRHYAQQAQKRRSKRKKRRKRNPQEFQGLTKKPLCERCVADEDQDSPVVRTAPPVLVHKRGRPRQVDTHHQYCPNEQCAFYGGTGRGNICANGHPNGGEWRQLYCGVCQTYFLETKGTIFYGKRLMARLMVRVLAGLAEGLGIRAVGRIFEVEPETVLAWLVEAAQQLELFSSYQLRALNPDQLQLDELYGLVSQVKTAEVGQPEAIDRPQRSSYWVWVALDPVSKLWLSLTVGDRTLACAQHLVHQVVQMLAPGCVPLFITDGLVDDELALLTHFGHWVQPQHSQGRRLKPRWMPLPILNYAQVIKKRRRRRLVQVSRRVIFGSLTRIKAQLAGHGWQINTAFVERLNLSIRQHVPTLGRRVSQLAKSVTSLRQQGLLYQTYYNSCLPHASLRRALPQPTQGRGSMVLWPPCTPAMAAGVTDNLWTLREVLLFRIPPCPQTGLG